MASNTENLNLLMKNPSTDGADTFNVDTMLNENWRKIDNNAGTVAQTLANILKPTTPPIIGLPPSATPNDMFNVLAHAGDLHVWRKTITSGTGTYSLGAVQEGLHYIKWANNSATSDSSGTFEYGSEIAVNNDGTITGIKNPSTITIKPWDDDASKANVFKGKFIKMISQVVTGLSRFEIGEIWWIPADAVMTRDLLNGQSDAWYIAASKRQQVIGVPAVTTVTYPVSTNRNAYQEGNDVKPAGYVVGEEKNVTINGMNGPILLTGNSLTVADDGTLSVTSHAQYGVYNSSTTEDVRSAVAGKYIYIPYNSGSVGFFKVASDVLVTGSTAPEGGSVFAFTAQPVTGYAVIPANTTIEYLGCLGDKARMQVVSYVGTGTYGSSNPNSLTFDFPPKIVIANGIHSTASYTNSYSLILSPQNGTGVSMQGSGRGYVYWVICEATDRTVSWYAGSYSDQLNESGIKYVAVAIG